MPPRPAGPGASLRAALALGLLLGFYLPALLLLVAVAALDVVLARGTFTVVTVEGCLGSLAVAWCVLRVVVLGRRPREGREGPPGLSLTPREQPELWEHVRRLAEQVRTRPPAEIRIVPGAVAMVREDARWLGLVPGERRLFLGVALLLGLPEAELDAVLGHELGHHAHHDTRLSPLMAALRGRLAHTVGTLEERAAREEAEERAEFAAKAARRRAEGRPPPLKRGGTRGPDHYLALLFTAYTKLCLRLTEAVGRREEYAADLVAARIAGPAVTAAALRRVLALQAADELYLNHYALLGWDAGLLPPEGQFYGGFALLLADGTRRAQLTALAREPLPKEPAEDRSPYASHPPTADRIRALESIPGDGRAPAAVRRPATALLRTPDRLLAGLEQATLSTEALSKRRVPWAELPWRARRETYAREAAPLLAAMAGLTGAPAAPGAVALRHLLDLLDHGLLRELAARLPRSEQAARSSGRAAREFARTALRSALRPLALLAALETGLCRWELCWAGPPVRRSAPAWFTEDLPKALDLAVAEPAVTAPLRTLLLRGSAHGPLDGTGPAPHTLA
ncbi:M48 family metalloprotease [Streptomyces sp. WP-1]|uniref:M48 family metalloprotease n=1 Tax=Streptomyces sp. WP-1 TaxID=3041497 RepID=UPI00264837C6|nr:M48 family metallopeptidase [Streptomyces sp. WP-1]WKE71274.1 M48 family metalloprotease [Streptomyces sp. WP-1]